MQLSRFALAHCMGLLALACSKEPVLQPAAGSDVIRDHPAVAEQEDNGVRLRVQTWPWRGDAEIEKEVTPLRVIIDNDSGQSIGIRFSDIMLVSNRAEKFHPLTLTDIDGEVYLDEEHADTVLEPRAYSGFRFAPYFSSIEPDLETHEDGAVSYDTGYYREYTYKVSLPTQEMYDAALPEGLLLDGGQVAGYLYFEKVDDDVGNVDLHAHFYEAADPTMAVAAIRVPLTTVDQ